MKCCDLSVGDWIITDNYYAYVLAVHNICYDAFDSEVQEDSSLQGTYYYSLVAYRVYCTAKGKRINRKPTYVTYGTEDCRRLTSDEQKFISKLLESASNGFDKWKNESAIPSSFESISVPVLSAAPKSVMNRFKKAIKQLPSPFVFTDLLKVCADVGSMDWGHIGEADGNCISFDMCYTIGNHKGGSILFDKIKNIDYTDTEEDKRLLEQLFTFESAFLSLARFVKEYDFVYPSDKNAALLARLKEIWNGLFHQNWEEQPLARDFFTHAPKELAYSFELAYKTVLEFLKRNVRELDCERLIDFLLEEEKEKRIYRKAYELMRGM